MYSAAHHCRTVCAASYVNDAASAARRWPCSDSQLFSLDICNEQWPHALPADGRAIFLFLSPPLSPCVCVCVGMCVRLCQCAPGRCLKLLQQGTTLHPLPTFRRQSSAVRVNGGMAHRNRLPSPRTQTVKIRPTHVHRMKDFSGCLGGRAANYISAQWCRQLLSATLATWYS